MTVGLRNAGYSLKCEDAGPVLTKGLNLTMIGGEPVKDTPGPEKGQPAPPEPSGDVTKPLLVDLRPSGPLDRRVAHAGRERESPSSTLQLTKPPRPAPPHPPPSTLSLPRAGQHRAKLNHDSTFDLGQTHHPPPKKNTHHH